MEIRGVLSGPRHPEGLRVSPQIADEGDAQGVPSSVKPLGTTTAG